MHGSKSHAYVYPRQNTLDTKTPSRAGQRHRAVSFSLRVLAAEPAGPGSAPCGRDDQAQHQTIITAKLVWRTVSGERSRIKMKQAQLILRIYSNRASKTTKFFSREVIDRINPASCCVDIWTAIPFLGRGPLSTFLHPGHLSTCLSFFPTQNS